MSRVGDVSANVIRRLLSSLAFNSKMAPNPNCRSRYLGSANNLRRLLREYYIVELVSYSHPLGQDYGHQVLNPSNQCQWCDLYDAAARSNSAWTNRPAVACDDQDKCTKQDTCNAGR